MWQKARLCVSSLGLCMALMHFKRLDKQCKGRESSAMDNDRLYYLTIREKINLKETSGLLWIPLDIMKKKILKPQLYKLWKKNWCVQRWPVVLRWPQPSSLTPGPLPLQLDAYTCQEGQSCIDQKMTYEFTLTFTVLRGCASRVKTLRHSKGSGHVQEACGDFRCVHQALLRDMGL